MVIFSRKHKKIITNFKSKTIISLLLLVLLPATAYAAPKVNNYYQASKLESQGDRLFKITDYQAALNKYKHSKNKWQDKTIETKINKVEKAITETKGNSTVEAENEEKVLGESDNNQSEDTVSPNLGNNKKYPTPTNQPFTPTPTFTPAPTTIILQNQGSNSINSNSASDVNKREGRTAKIRPTFHIPTPNPCVCIESWGAGDFVGNCKGVDTSCIIKYSCLLSDKKRLGVWNDEQTVCLEEHVRYVGDQSNSPKPQTNLGLSQSECNEKKKLYKQKEIVRLQNSIQQMKNL
jgi:hypothetical protein